MSKPISSQQIQDPSRMNENWDESKIAKDATAKRKETDTNQSTIRLARQAMVPRKLIP